MTTADVVAALAGARVCDLARPLDAETPVSPNHPPFQHALLRRHGDHVREGGWTGANDVIVLGGHTGTHIDALCHVALDGRLHGGVDAAEASRGGFFREHGIETVAPILCRGVLLDVPAALGVETLEPGRPVSAADVETAARHHGVRIERGDAVLVRTGWPVRTLPDRTAYLGWESGVPGPDESAARLLAERGIRVTGSDTIAYEWLAPGAGHTRLPVHALLLVEAGIHIVELLDLEELARERVYEFLFVAAPLKMVGATGSPIRPLAVSVRAS